jgi:hypothetical protein
VTPRGYRSDDEQVTALRLSLSGYIVAAMGMFGSLGKTQAGNSTPYLRVCWLVCLLIGSGHLLSVCAGLCRLLVLLPTLVNLGFLCGCVGTGGRCSLFTGRMTGGLCA